MRSRPRSRDAVASGPRHGAARVLSKLGYCSRAQARALVLEGRVVVNGRVCRDPEAPVDLARADVQVDGRPIRAEAKIYLMLNKPRGLVTSREDQDGRETVYECFRDAVLPWISPVGRLDKASEGLILFTNDSLWAERILTPSAHVEKVYHVQIDCLASDTLCQRLIEGVKTREGDFLAARKASVLRQGTRNSWLELGIDEGKNRHLRRLLEALNVRVLRLVRVAIGALVLGSLARGQYRHLTADEVRSLSQTR